MFDAARHASTAAPVTSSIAVCQGELAVSGDPGVRLTAVLGSCIATCLWDPIARLGGMNHVLLPGRRALDRGGNKFGIYAMEALINELMKKGACKSDLVAKIFGGACIFENGLRIGDANVEFAQDYLDREGIPIVAQSTGGHRARRVQFFPECGRARQMLAAGPDFSAHVDDFGEKPGVRTVAVPSAKPGEVELF